jgi:small subunit ribosomal protein S20
MRRSQMRTYIRKVEEAIAAADPAKAVEALHQAEPVIKRAAQKGIVHVNTAARKVSRLARKVNALSKSVTS